MPTRAFASAVRLCPLASGHLQVRCGVPHAGGVVHGGLEAVTHEAAVLEAALGAQRANIGPCRSGAADVMWRRRSLLWAPRSRPPAVP